MDAVPPGSRERLSFGELLRRHRVAAGLTQEGLAERAHLSAQAITALERGTRRSPYGDTVRLLAEALGLGGAERAAFEAAARYRGAPPAGAPGLLPGQGTTGPEQAPAGGGAVAAPALPGGTLTFLLTDIEGSTALWERHPAAMREALARHDALFDELLARLGGRQVKERGEGDSIFAVFASPSAALAAVCALQQALLAEPWPPETPLRVRMGMHTGEAELRGLGYYGVTVNRTARIRSLAHGGQILLSQATHDLVRDALPEGVMLRSLGSHGLKGIQRPEEIVQVLHPSLPGNFPPLQSPRVSPTNLPVQPTSFVGREREQEVVAGLLGRSPLVTLTGTGGVGKTRLALEVAAALVAEYPDGVWLVELAALADPGLVPQAVAAALGVREEPGRPLLATLAATLQPKCLLLVLDNCEHIIGTCAELATALLQDCPSVRLLATSREALEVAGETLYRVPSLAVPDPDCLPPLDEVPAYEAVQLFLQRARSRRPDFTLVPQNARAVAEICARLDGMPLALELAAARMSALAVEGIAARLDDRFRLLTGGPRTALPRHQTLRAILDWSHDLLTVGERVLLRRLAVFAGGYTLEAAEAVGMGNGVEDWEVLDLLNALVNKSLVLLEERDGEGRYRLLETVRQYAAERLEAAGEGAAVRERHLGWYLALAERAEPALTGPEQGDWLSRLELEHDNVRAALRWSSGEGCGPEAGLRLAGALDRFWEMRGHLGEGRGWLEAALTRDGSAAPEVRARALNAAGTLACFQGDYTRAMPLLEEGLALFMDQGDGRGIARSLHNLGLVAGDQGDYERAQALYEQSLALFRDLEDKGGIAVSLGNLGQVAHFKGDYERAQALYEESLALFRDLEDKGGISHSLGNLGLVAAAKGNYGRAMPLLEEGLALVRDLGDKQGMASSLHNLGGVEGDRGDYERARVLYEEGLALFKDLGDRLGIAHSLNDLAALAVTQGQPQRAARLFGSAAALRESLGAPLLPIERAAHDAAVAALRHALPEAALDAAWAAGRAMPMEQAVADALVGDLPSE